MQLNSFCAEIPTTSSAEGEHATYDSLNRLATASTGALFRSKNFRLSNGATFVFNAAFSVMFLGNVLFLKELWHYGTMEIGLAMTVGPLCVIPSALLTGKYAGKHGHAKPLLLGGLLYAASALIRLVTLESGADFLRLWLPTAILTGVGLGMILPSLSSSATFDLPPARYSIGSGVKTPFGSSEAYLGSRSRFFA